MLLKVPFLLCISGFWAIETAGGDNATSKICHELTMNYTNQIRTQVKKLVKLEMSDAFDANSSQSAFDQNIRSHFMDMVSNVTRCYNITDNTAHINIANIKLELLKNALEAKEIKDLFINNNGLSCIRGTAKSVYDNAVIMVVGNLTKNTIMNVNPLDIDKEKCNRNTIIMKRAREILTNNSLCYATVNYFMTLHNPLDAYCNDTGNLENVQTQAGRSNTIVIVIVLIIVVILVSIAGIVMLRKGMCRKTKKLRVTRQQTSINPADNSNGIPLN